MVEPPPPSQPRPNTDFSEEYIRTDRSDIRHQQGLQDDRFRWKTKVEILGDLGLEQGEPW